MSVYRSILDLPYFLHPSLVDVFAEGARTLYSQADAWESGGFYSNAEWWRYEARMRELDKYRVSVILGMEEEDEELEEEIEGLVAKWEGTTIAR